MSSRVQKGSTVFRPIINKARPRTQTGLSRQPSVEEFRIENSLSESHFSPTNPNLIGSSNSNQSRQIFTEKGFENGNALRTLPEKQFLASRDSVPPVVGSTATAPINSLQFPPELTGTPAILVGSLSNQTTITPQSQEVRTNVFLPEVSLTNDRCPDVHIISSNAAVPIERSTLLSDANNGQTIHENQGQAENVPDSRRKSQENDQRKSKKRKTIRQNDSNDIDNESWPTSSAPRPRRRAPSLPPFDPDADPGEDVDPTIVTMSSLCADSGQGRVSSKAAEILTNHAAWKGKNKEKRARMKLLMEAKKYGREEEETHNNTEEHGNNNQVSQGAASVDSQPQSAAVDDTEGFDYSQDLATSRYNVQVRIGPNGETVIDENSLIVDRVEDDGTEDYTHVIESDHTKFINSGTYGKRYRGSKWSAEETELFYEALAQYGENYELIAYILPGRDRKSCKNKFKVEDKKNHARINHCLENSVPVDIKTLERMTGKDFSGPIPEIRAPAPIANIALPEEPSTLPEEPAKATKKRNRNKGHFGENGAIVIGSID